MEISRAAEAPEAKVELTEQQIREQSFEPNPQKEVRKIIII